MQILPAVGYEGFSEFLLQFNTAYVPTLRNLRLFFWSKQILSEGRVILALFSFVRTNDNITSTEEWSPAQFEELQLQVLHPLDS